MFHPIHIDGLIWEILAKFPAPLFTLVAAILASSIAVITLRTHAAVNLRNKRADVIMHCNVRYDELYKLRVQLESADREPEEYEVKSYFRRYWGLKSDQLDYWLAGYVDPETLTSWFMSTLDALLPSNGDPPPTVGGITYAENWNIIHKEHDAINPRLVQIVAESLHLVLVPARLDRYARLLILLKGIEKNERKLIRQLSRNNHKRVYISAFAGTLLEPMRSAYRRAERLEHFQTTYSYAAPENSNGETPSVTSDKATEASGDR